MIKIEEVPYPIQMTHEPDPYTLQFGNWRIPLEGALEVFQQNHDVKVLATDLLGVETVSLFFKCGSKAQADWLLETAKKIPKVVEKCFSILGHASFLIHPDKIEVVSGNTLEYRGEEALRKSLVGPSRREAIEWIIRAREKLTRMENIIFESIAPRFRKEEMGELVVNLIEAIPKGVGDFTIPADIREKLIGVQKKGGTEFSRRVAVSSVAGFAQTFSFEGLLGFPQEETPTPRRIGPPSIDL